MRGAGNRRWSGRVGCWLLLVAWAVPCLAASPAARLPQRVYVWQRAWTTAVANSVAEHAGAFAVVEVLAADVSFAPRGPTITRVTPAWRVLHGRGVAVVVRVGPTASAWTEDAPETRAVIAACRDALAAARSGGIEPAELQLDFDAATARLAAYRRLLGTIRLAVAPPRLVITTLPAWLASADFAALAAAADAFVLQVHSLDRPTTFGAPVVLCDVARARGWIELADRVGQPFRVALPTYGYRVAFAASGEFLGLQAEGGGRAWPAGAIVRTVLANPTELAPLVARLRHSPPRHCEAISWFRLPTPDDELTWRWPTLAAVMNGVVPRPQLVLRVAPAADGSVDLAIANEGDGPAELAGFAVVCPGARVVACDAAPGCTLRRVAPDRIAASLTSTAGVLPPGEVRPLGWIRLSVPVELHADFP